MMRAAKQVTAGPRRFAEGVLVELAAAVRDARDGDLIALTSTLEETGDDLAAWSSLTGRDLFPLAESIAAVREHWQKERAIHETLAEIFHCA